MDQEYTEWEINRMKEKYYEINNSIRTYNTKVNSNNEEISRLNKRLNELIVIKKNLKRSDEKFDRYLNTKKRKFEILRSSYYNTKFARDCSEEILDFINGRETLSARNSIESAINEVQRKFNKLSLDIEELKKNNNTLKNRIYDLEYERKLILQKGVI